MTQFPQHPIMLNSTQNPRVKSWSSLLEKKGRDKAGMFLAEGIHLVQEALRAGLEISAVVYDAERGVPEELAAALARLPEARIFAASPGVMAKCTGTDTPPPVFAVVGKPEPDLSAPFRPGCLAVVLDGVRDPGNVGTIIRTADAVGADAVLLGKGCADPYNPKTVRSTMGSLFHVPVVTGDLRLLLPEAKRKGIRLVGTSLQATASCYELDWKPATWLLMGSEADGLSADSIALMDEAVRIPMRGKAESLNVAMASTVLLYEAMRQRMFSKQQ
jgi:rRNA methylases